MKGSAWGLVVGALLSIGAAEARPTVSHRAVHHQRLAKARTNRPGVAIAAVAGPTERAYQPALSSRSDEWMPTSLRYRFGRGRVVGAVGYNRVTDSYEIDPHEVNSAAGTQLGHPDDTVGARVSVPF